jgi:hypothetical protein
MGDNPIRGVSRAGRARVGKARVEGAKVGREKEGRARMGWVGGGGAKEKEGGRGQAG